MSRYHVPKGAPIGDAKAVKIADEMTRLDPLGKGVTARQFHLSQEPEEAPLHQEFEWQDDVAAVLYRDEQARRLIRVVVYEAEGKSGETHEVRAFQAVVVSGEVDEAGDTLRLYKPTEIVMANDGESNQILMDAMRQLRGWRNRYRAYDDIYHRLGAVFQTIDEHLDAAD